MKNVYKIFLFSFLALSFVVPFSASAESCDCWCKSVNGADNLGQKESSNTCYDFCRDEDEKFLGCYSDKETASLPENNQLCWTREQCESTVAMDVTGESPMLDDDNKEMVYEWGDQNKNCIKGEGYCYRPPEKIKLGMPIGDMTEVGDLGTYVDVFYSWLLPAASLLAIVLIMIGGFQWAIARGDSGMVKKAKDRITKAVFGLLILFGVYAIAYLIDPRLTSFDQLRVPVIQTIIFIDENTTCENIYKAAGGDVSITPISGSSNIPICGDKGLISFEGKNTSILGVQTDDTCIYGWCDSDLERCVQIAGQSDVYSCLKCADIYSGGDFGITPSNSECSKMINFDIAQDYEDNNSYIYCKYLDAGLGVLNTDTCAELVYPNMAGNDVVNCDILKQDALASYGAATCRAYDNVSARTNGYTFEKEVDDLPGKDQDFPLLLEVCEDDPCNFAPDGGCHVVSYNPTFCTWPVISQIAFCQDIGRIIRADCVTQEFSDWLSDWYELTSNGVGLLEYDDFYLLLSEMPGIEGIDQNGDSVEIDFHKTIFN